MALALATMFALLCTAPPKNNPQMNKPEKQTRGLQIWTAAVQRTIKKKKIQVEMNYCLKCTSNSDFKH